LFILHDTKAGWVITLSVAQKNRVSSINGNWLDCLCFNLTNIYNSCTVLLYRKEESLTIQTTYTQARDGLAKLLDEVTHNREVVLIQRRGEENVAMIAASELESLMETAYLLRSPANSERLLTALNRALKNEGENLTTLDLSRQVGLD
jgi:antitoxin YefM